MNNIVDYVYINGMRSFEELKFQAEDALALCQFTYLKFDGLLEVMSEKPVSIKELNTPSSKEKLFFDYRYEKDNRALFEAMAMSKRFRNLKMCMYINKIEEDTQFSALTFILPYSNAIIVFRGTDENIVGWQEDMGLALEKPIVGQELSVKYIADVSKRFSGRFFIAGHSKGGNLAMYGAMLSSKPIKDRIKNIYCFDSPGFRKSFLKENNYEEIKGRIKKFIPKSSVVGMILDNGEDCSVVEARSLGLSQHNPYMWVFKEGRFSKAELTEGHLKMIETLNDWIYRQDEEHLERFVSFLNTMMQSSQADTTMDFKKDFVKNSMEVIKAATEIDDSTKEVLGKVIKSYFQIAKDMVKESLKESVEEGFKESIVDVNSRFHFD